MPKYLLNHPSVVVVWNFTEPNCLAALDHSVGSRKYKESVYLMGRSAIDHHKQKGDRTLLKHGSTCIHTEFWKRITDPELNIHQLMSTRYRKDAI